MLLIAKPSVKGDSFQPLQVEDAYPVFSGQDSQKLKIKLEQDPRIPTSSSLFSCLHSKQPYWAHRRCLFLKIQLPFFGLN